MFKVTTNKKGNLKIGQLPDLHLGAKFKDFNKLNPQTGINYMWDEQIKDLSTCTDILIEEDVAVAIFPGDIYDKKSGISDKLQSALRENILRLLDADIAVVLITGNHDFPKTREYKALISCFDGYDKYMNVIPVWKAQYDTVAINDEILIHVIPQCFSETQYKEELLNVKRDTSYDVNVFTTHTGVTGTTVEDILLDTGWVNISNIDALDVDYIALGHYHKPYKVSPKAAYAGVMSKCNFSDKDSKHGVLIFNGETKELSFRGYETRGMDEFVINCRDKDAPEINKDLEDILSSLNKEHYIKIVFNDISKMKQKQIDYNIMHTIKDEAFYCRQEYNFLKEEESDSDRVATADKIKPLEEQFQDNLKKIAKSEDDFKRIFTLYKKTINVEEN